MSGMVGNDYERIAREIIAELTQRSNQGRVQQQSLEAKSRLAGTDQDVPNMDKYFGDRAFVQHTADGSNYEKSRQQNDRVLKSGPILSAYGEGVGNPRGKFAQVNYPTFPNERNQNNPSQPSQPARTDSELQAQAMQAIAGFGNTPPESPVVAFGSTGMQASPQLHQFYLSLSPQDRINLLKYAATNFMASDDEIIQNFTHEGLSNEQQP